MGLRCLLGHDFGPSGVVREHEEDGSEMVVTEREIRRCRRCGEEQVLSESTEVRAIRMEDDVRQERRDADAVAPASNTQGADVDDGTSPLGPDAGDPTSDGPAPESTPDPSAPRTAAESVTADGDAGASVEASSETPPAPGPQPTSEEDADAAESKQSLIERAEAGFDEPADPEEEDAVILDDDDAAPERGYGEWPDSDDTAPSNGSTGGADADTDVPTNAAEVDADGPADTDGDAETDDGEEPRSLAERAAEEDAELMGGGPDESSEPVDTSTETAESTEGAWPAHEREDEGFSAGAATAGGPGMAYGNELTPQSTNGQSRSQSQDDDYETSYLDNTVEQRDGDGTIVSAGDSTTAPPRPGVETEYYCPSCGHTRPLDSSLRTGDICPECQQGYIAERER
jgi:hypothetical protein